MTVRTNVTAPHSRRSTAQFTSRRFYLDPDVAIRPDSFRPPPRVPYQPPPCVACGGGGSAGEQSVRPHPCRAPRATSALTRAYTTASTRADHAGFIPPATPVAISILH